MKTIIKLALPLLAVTLLSACAVERIVEDVLTDWTRPYPRQQYPQPYPHPQYPQPRFNHNLARQCVARSHALCNQQRQVCRYQRQWTSCRHLYRSCIENARHTCNQSFRIYR